MSRPEGTTTRLLLVRHGEVDPRWRGTIYGRLDVPLSERGLEQSELVAAALEGEPLDAVISSGLQRAEAAAALIRATRPGLERVDDPGLLELDRGEWAGRAIRDLERESPELMAAWRASRGAMAAPGGEEPEALAGRVRGALARIAAAHPGRTVAVVAHLWVVRSALTACLGLSMSQSGRLGLPPGGICELEWPSSGSAAGGFPRLLAMGR